MMKTCCSGIHKLAVRATTTTTTTTQVSSRSTTLGSLCVRRAHYTSPATKAGSNQWGRSKTYGTPLILGGAALLLYYALEKHNSATNQEGGGGKPTTTTATTALVKKPGKPRVVVLGSGWAALEFVRNVNTDIFDVVVVSPRNYFLYTPLLPSATVGTLEVRSVTEPLRKFCIRSNSTIQFYEAACTDIDPEANRIQCEDSSDIKGKVSKFPVDYDILVVAVGSVNATLGVKGVVENCLFLKEAPDVSKIRDRLMDCFESSNLPGQPDDEKKRLLHFVVVGGGPTGVEFAAELHDFVTEDLKKYFPEVVQDVKITLVQSAEHILNTYDAKIQEYAEKQFSRQHIELLTNSRVIDVKENSLVVVDKATKKEEILPFGMCVWAAGVSPNPLAVNLAAKLEAQTNKRALVTNEFLKIKGSNNIYAIGDCATVSQRKLVEKFVELFQLADVNHDGVLEMSEFKALVETHRKSYPQFETYVKGIEKCFADFDTDKNGTLDLQEFKRALDFIDNNMKALPTTAQCASQEGKYLGTSLTLIQEGKPIEPFHYKHFGSFAYVGGDSAVADIPGTVQSGGFGVWWLWRATYFSKQMSIRNRVLVGFDWIKAFLFGRDISRV